MMSQNDVILHEHVFTSPHIILKAFIAVHYPHSIQKRVTRNLDMKNILFAEGDFVERSRDGFAYVTCFQPVLSVRIRRCRATSLPAEVRLNIFDGFCVVLVTIRKSIFLHLLC
jgi:hypothetical protein